MRGSSAILPDSERPAVDTADDVRTTLAQLTARARRLASQGDTNLVSLNSRGVAEVSRRTEATLRRQPYSTASSQASVELFMARNFAFDLQEQQRIIQQLQRNYSEAGVDRTSAEDIMSDEGHRLALGSDVNVSSGADSVVEAIKYDLLRKLRNQIHQTEQEHMQSRNHELLKAGWKSFYLGVSDDFDAVSAAMEHNLHDQTHTLRPLIQRNTLGTPYCSSNFLAFLSSESPLAQDANRAIAAFSLIVDQYSSHQWVNYFASYSAERKDTGGNDIAVLWATVQAIISPLRSEQEKTSMLSYVACSRRVIENKCHHRLLTIGTRVDPSREEELSAIPADRFYEIVQVHLGGNPWSHVYAALKAGRYDAALLAAHQIGAASLVEAIEKYANASPEERQSLPPCVALRVLYAEDATQSDPFRKAVLFVLLAARTGEEEAEIEKTLVTLGSKVSSSLEDMLWLRLMCIRTETESPAGGRIQSLAYLQKAIVDDLQDLIHVAQGNIPRLACFLFHAILPATGLRLLIENVTSYVDGIHMSLCFSAANLLSGSDLESSLDLKRHLARYCGMILINNGGQATKERQQAGLATFSYFQKSGLTDAFVDFCQSDVLCSKLFGQRTGGGSGVLVQRNALPSKELLTVMHSIAETAASRSNYSGAIHMLSTLAQLVEKYSGPEKLLHDALRRAVQIAASALSQIFYLPNQSAEATIIIEEASNVLRVIHRVGSNETGVPAGDLNDLNLLCLMSNVYAACGSQQWEHALGSFFYLPFVPKSITVDVDSFVQAYCSASPLVITGGGAIIPLAFRSAIHLLQSYQLAASSPHPSIAGDEFKQKSASLIQQMEAVAQWIRRVSSQLCFTDLPQEVCEFEQRFLN